MIVGFMTELEGGSRSHFPEKILASLDPTEVADYYTKMYNVNFFDSWELFNYEFNYSVYLESLNKPKIHTIREDINSRYNTNLKLDYFINVRTKQMFRFAPKKPIISIQEISFKYLPETSFPVVQIDGVILSFEEIEQLAINDGFDSIESFFQWFKDDFKGRLIHWTDKKY